MDALDARVYASDPALKLAEAELQGQLDGEGWKYVSPVRVQTGNRRLSLRAAPDEQAAQVTEALPGEALELLWSEGEWTRLRTVHDRYLGWAKKGWIDGAADLNLADLNLTVTALRAHAFAGPKVSQPIVAELCFGARVARGAGEVVPDEQRRWVPVVLPDGQAAYVQEVCFAPVPESSQATKEGRAAFALRFLETPYVWGGRSAWGLDCSGLTQLVYAAFGQVLPRDADQQQAAMQAVSTPEPGDLAFFKGHVGLMIDERHMIHANATHMKVSIETLGEGDYGQRLERGLLGFGRLS